MVNDSLHNTHLTGTFNVRTERAPGGEEMNTVGS